MTGSRTTALAAMLTAAAALIGGTAAAAQASTTARPPAQIHPNITGYGDGYGATPAAAEHAAVIDLRGNYGGCGPYSLVYDDQMPNGTWHAEVVADCRWVN